MRAKISPTHQTEVMATMKAVFMARCKSEHVSTCSKGDLIKDHRTRFGCLEGVGLISVDKDFECPS